MKSMDKELFWSSCRKHSHELLAKDAWYCLFQEDLGPENSAYKELKKCWPEMDTTPNANVLLLDNNEEQVREKLVEFYTKILNKQSQDHNLLIRGDYQQIAEIRP